MAEHAPALAGHVDRHVDRFLHVAAGLGEHLPHLAAHQLGQLVLAVLEQPREAEQDRAALRRGNEPPLLERGFRRLDGAVDVRGGRARERAERLARRRDARLEHLAGRPLEPLAADEVLARLRGDCHAAECTGYALLEMWKFWLAAGVVAVATFGVVAVLGLQAVDEDEPAPVAAKATPAPAGGSWADRANELCVTGIRDAEHRRAPARGRRDEPAAAAALLPRDDEDRGRARRRAAEAARDGGPRQGRRGDRPPRAGV